MQTTQQDLQHGMSGGHVEDTGRAAVADSQLIDIRQATTALDASKLTPAKATWAERGILFAIMTLVIVLDQISKRLIESWLPLNSSYQPFPPLGELFQISHVSNTGAAFGLFQDNNVFFIVVAVVVSVVIVVYNRYLPGGHPLFRIALGMQLGGALGNLIDRFRLGHVTDFLDFGSWPVFNLADFSIVSGVVLMAILLFREDLVQQRAAKAEEKAKDGVDTAEDRTMI